MPLSPGDKLGPHEILALLGAGGMGEVYRARDTKLKRDVALKVLPDAFARDPDRMSRFEREAALLASLNHPNIAAIYGVEGDALVMECVDGQTLPSPLPIDTALHYARQIAEALEYAHDRGVIHRDLKPANIKVTEDGAVKLLDFGLAKSLEDQPASSEDPRNSPTVTVGPTRVGVILGTAAYMSPEQASGRNADRRADIWSFGVVLYEMLAGKQAFQGESASDTLATVLKLDPDWSALPADTPAAVRNLLQRCLTKDRKQRLQAIGEARILLEHPNLNHDAQGAVTALASSRSRLRDAGWVAAVLASAVAAVALWGWLRPTPPEPRAIVRLSTPLAVATVPAAIAFARDGSRMAFVGGPAPAQIHVRTMNQIDATPLAGTTDAAFLSFSPDGQQISFVQRGASGSQLKKVAVAGGLPQTLTEVWDRFGPPTQTWAEDGNIYFTSDGVVMRIPAGGGKPSIIAAPDRDVIVAYVGPQLLPGGRELLVGSPWTRGGRGQIMALNLQSGARKTLLERAETAIFVPSGSSTTAGHLVYYTSSTATLMAVAFDVERLETRGEPVPVLEGVRGFSTSPFPILGISNSGTLAYIPGSVAQGGLSTLVWMDRKGGEQPVAAPARAYGSVRLSPTDPNRIAMTVLDDQRSDVWVYDASRGVLDRITTDGSNLTPIWTPDGKQVVFERTPFSGQGAAMWAPADRSAPPSVLATKDKGPIVPTSVSADGKLVIGYYPLDKGLWVLPLPPGSSAGGTPQLILESQFQKNVPDLSPDGRWIAYAADDSSRSEVYVSSYPAAGPNITISSGGGGTPRWSSTGRELFYRNRTRFMAVDVQLSPTFRAGRPRQLFEAADMGAWDVTPDGQRFLMVKRPSSPAQTAPDHATVVLNWFEELRRLAPFSK